MNATAPLSPFGSAALFDDTLAHVVGFLIVLTAAHPLGLLFPRFLKLPLITGYLLVGILTGPFVSNLLTTTSVQLLSSSINAMALSFISFQAGQEIYLPELRPQIRGILQLLVVLYGTAMVLLTAVLTLGAGPFFYGAFDSACKLAIALLFASIAVLGSPATVMAIKIELDSVGPFTNLMLGATMTAEFVVLVSFSVARVVSSVYCAKLAISFGNLLFTLGIVFSNLVVGAIIGLVIIAIFSIPGASHDEHDDEHDKRPSGIMAVVGSLYFKGFLWLFAGYFFYISTAVISEATSKAFGHVWDVKFEPLLVLMVASCLAGHYTKIRHDMHVILDAAAPFVFLPFFVMTGAALKLNQVAQAIPLMSLFVSLRYVAIFVACYGAGRFLLKLPPHQYNNLWLTMTPQAGVALGLANEIKGLSKDPWAAEFAATIVAAVVVNQIVGPVLCAMGLTRAGESQLAGGNKTIQLEGVTPGAPSDGHDLESAHARVDATTNHHDDAALLTVRKAVVVGDDDAAFELALQLVLHGADVALPLLNDDFAAQWDALQDHLRVADSRGDVVVPSLAPFRSESRPRGDVDDDASARTRIAVADRETDLVLFTGDDQRALDHARALHTMGGRKPRLVAILETAALLDALRQSGVVCIQSSVALANIGLRLSFLDVATAANVVSMEAGTSGEKPWRHGGLCVPAAGSSCAELQRVVLHRRRVLQRNLETAQQLEHMVELPRMVHVPPPRVSMFGRASTVEFLGNHNDRGVRSLSRRGHQSNFIVSNDVYVMGGGANGEGGFEDGPIDDAVDIYTASMRSGRAFVASMTTPTTDSAGGEKRAKLLAKMLRKKEFKVHRGNHRM